MAIRRTTGVFPGGGEVVLAGLPHRKALWFQNQSATLTAEVSYASGFTIKSLAPSGVVNRAATGSDIEGLQGAITLRGTAGEAYDAEETY